MTDQERYQQLIDKKRMGELQTKRNSPNVVEEPVEDTSMGLSPEAIEYQDNERRDPYSYRDKLASGLTLGYNDKIIAARDAALGIGPEGGVFNYEGDFSDRYKGNLTAERRRETAYDKENPVLGAATEMVGTGVLGGGLANAGITATKLVPQALKGIPKALATITAASGEGAAYGALSANANDTSEAEGAGMGATFGAAFSALPMGVRKALNSAVSRKIGKTLMDKAGNFTPINIAAGEESLLRSIYQKVVGVAYGGSELHKQSRKVLERTIAKQEAANLIHNKKAIDAAMPKGHTTSNVGRDAMSDLKTAYNDAYTSAWAGATKYTKAGVKRFKDLASKLSGGSTVNGRAKITALTDQLDDQLKQGNPEALRAFDNTLRVEAKQAVLNDPDLAKNINLLRDTYKANLNKNVKAKIDVVDKTYPSYLTVKKAAVNDMTKKSVFEGAPLARASKQVGGETKAGTGKSPLIDEADAQIASAAKTKEQTDLIKKRMPPDSPNFIQRATTTAGLGAVPLGPVSLLTPLSLAAAPLTLPAGALMANRLAKPGVQQFIAGQGKNQRSIAAALRGYDRGASNIVRPIGKGFNAAIINQAAPEQ